TAIAGTSWRPSFAELDSAANGIARDVAARGDDAAAPVALLMRHDAPQIAAMLAAVKAGRTAVVLNPSDPPARLEQIRADLGPQAVLVDGRNRELALEAGFEPGQLLTVAERPEAGAAGPPETPPAADDLAFLIYTSGSTG